MILVFHITMNHSNVVHPCIFTFLYIYYILCMYVCMLGFYIKLLIIQLNMCILTRSLYRSLLICGVNLSVPTKTKNSPNNMERLFNTIVFEAGIFLFLFYCNFICNMKIILQLYFEYRLFLICSTYTKQHMYTRVCQ